MKAQVRQALQEGGVGWAKDYAGTWSDSLAWKWVLNTPSVMKYLNSNLNALEDQINRAKDRGGVSNGQRGSIERGAAILRQKMTAIEAAYTGCVLRGFVRAGRHLDKAHEIRETGYSARGDLQKAIFATSSKIEQMAQEHLASAFACVDKQVMPLLAEPVFFKEVIACEIGFGFDCPAPDPDAQPEAAPAAQPDKACSEENEIGFDINNTELDTRILDAQGHLVKLRFDLAEMKADLADFGAEMEELAKRPPYEEPGVKPTFDDTLDAMVLDDIPQDMHRDVVTAAVDKNGGWTGDFTLQDLPPDLAAKAWEYLKKKRRDDSLAAAERLRDLVRHSQRTRTLIALLTADIQAVESRITQMKSFRNAAWEEKVQPLNPCITGPQDLGELGSPDPQDEAEEPAPPSDDGASLVPNTSIPNAMPLFKPDGFEGLRVAGLTHQELSTNAAPIWTDTNENDPGITFLETMLYAISDLGYRTNLPDLDLLAPPGLPNEGEKMEFFSGADVSP